MYKLLQDINYPGTFIPAGTLCEVSDGFVKIGNKGLNYSVLHVKNSPDWFEEVPKWTDEDMLKFGEFVFIELWGHNAESHQLKVKQLFDDFLK